jgi:hypothetical protein
MKGRNEPLAIQHLGLPSLWVRKLIPEDCSPDDRAEGRPFPFRSRTAKTASNSRTALGVSRHRSWASPEAGLYRLALNP